LEFIKDWITNIILFVLLATVIDMLLPNSNMQKYTKMVTGLLLIAIILTPIFKLIASDFESALATVPLINTNGETNMKNLIELKKKEIQASQHAYILEQMAVQLEKDVEEELMNQSGFKITNIDFQLKDNDSQAFPDNLKKVIVKVQRPKTKEEAVEVVSKVDISTATPPRSKNKKNEHEDIIRLLSKKWNIENKTIEVIEEGGITNHNG
jgi:stage III sporulation protein AF